MTEEKIKPRNDVEDIRATPQRECGEGSSVTRQNDKIKQKFMKLLWKDGVREEIADEELIDLIIQETREEFEKAFLLKEKTLGKETRNPDYLALLLHNWYLEIVRALPKGSFNPDANKPFEGLTEEQKAIDRFIAIKVLDLLEIERRKITGIIKQKIEEKYQFPHGFQQPINAKTIGDAKLEGQYQVIKFILNLLEEIGDK